LDKRYEKISDIMEQCVNKKLKIRIGEVASDIKNHGIRLFDGKRCITGYSYNEFYDWDLYFENLVMSYFGIYKYCRNGVEMFLDRQLECGFVARTAINPRHRQHFKPFLAQIALLGIFQSEDIRWLEGSYYEKLKKYLDYWFWYSDLDKNGLCVWDSADHSGMDNQRRRAGLKHSMTIEGVDLNCYLVRELEAMSVISEMLGFSSESQSFRQHSKHLSETINELMWNEEDGFYYDRHERNQNHIKVKSVAGFIPLWAGIVSESRAERLVTEHFDNTDEFRTPYPVPAWARCEPDYVQQKNDNCCNWMGTTWIPTNYMVFHGLIKYGFKNRARTLAEKTFEMVMGEPDTREYYNAENGCGIGLNPFWGWSALGYFMVLEHKLNYDPTDLENTKILALARDYLGMEF
jgi:hypothetical protein